MHFPLFFTFHRHFTENEQTYATIQSFGANISGAIQAIDVKFGCIMGIYIVSRCPANSGLISQILLKILPKDDFSYHLIYRQQRLVKQLQIGYIELVGENFSKQVFM